MGVSAALPGRPAAMEVASRRFSPHEACGDGEDDVASTLSSGGSINSKSLLCYKKLQASRLEKMML